MQKTKKNKKKSLRLCCKLMIMHAMSLEARFGNVMRVLVVADRLSELY